MPYQPGDILFFTAPPQPNPFAQRAMNAQWFLSCLSCSCDTEDYKKTHVAICIAVPEEKGENKEVIIANFNSKTYKYQQDSLTKLSASLIDRRIDILRPTNPEFAATLAKIAANQEASSVELDNDSMKKSLLCCALSATQKTQSGLSVKSHCSRFVAEVINIASSQHDKKSQTHANVTVMRLWQNLVASKLYDVISPQTLEEKTEADDSFNDNRPEKQSLLTVNSVKSI